jgi:peroxin-1
MFNRRFYKATIRRLRPPMNPNAPPQANTAPIAPSSVPRVLNAGGNASEEAKDASGPKKVHEVFVGWAEGLPESHIVLTSAIDEVDEWDLVRWVMTVHCRFCCVPSVG